MKSAFSVLVMRRCAILIGTVALTSEPSCAVMPLQPSCTVWEIVLVIFILFIIMSFPMEVL